MTASEKPSKQLLGVFGLLRDTFQLYFSHFQLYFGYAAWLLIPLVLTVLAFVTTEADVFEYIDFAAFLLHTILLIWATIIFISITKRLHEKKSVPARKVSEMGWNLWTPFLLAYALTALIELAGIFLLIVPGIIFFVWFEFAAIIVVLERTPILASLSTSRELSRGRFWQVLWRLAGGACILLLFYALFFGAALYAGYAGSEQSIYDYLLTTPSLPEEVIYRLIDIIILPLFVIYQTRLYLELKAHQ